MSREEAIKELTELLPEEFLMEYAGAIKMAIKALEQETCEDAISRQAVLEAIDVKAWEFCDYLIRNGRNDEQKPISHFAGNLRECVGEDLPSVTPQPKMEPCEDMVSRDAMWEVLQRLYGTEGELVEELMSLPPVLPMPKMGRWIVSKENYLGTRNGCCSNCKNFYTNDWNEMNYCPNCGSYNGGEG